MAGNQKSSIEETKSVEMKLLHPVKEWVFKILIIGDTLVGKTCFVKRYVTDIYSSDWRGTIGVDFALKVIKWSDRETVKLQLWDIAGYERYGNMARIYYKGAHACIMIFDIARKDSFNNILKWKHDLDAKCTLPDGRSIPGILLANKCDLEKREVENVEVDNMCRECGFLDWMVISTKEGFVIEELMRSLIEAIFSSGSF